MTDFDIAYILRCDTVTDEDDCPHIVYGITALNCFGKTLATFADIFFDKQKAIDFVKLCNSERLELIHLADVVEDALE